MQVSALRVLKIVVINSVENKQILQICACLRDNRLYEKTYTRKVASVIAFRRMSCLAFMGNGAR